MGAAVVRQLEPLGAEIHVIDLKEPPVPVAGFQAVDLMDPDATASAVETPSVGRSTVCSTVPGFRVAGSRTSTPCWSTSSVSAIWPTWWWSGWSPGRPSPTSRRGREPAGRATSRSGCLSCPRRDSPPAKQWLEDHPDEIASGYAPSKEVIIVWTVWRSLALAEKGIRINCTLPGPTDTPMMPDFEEQMGKAFMDNYPIPLGHRQTPDEQAAPLVFLNSPAASAITGEAILTDGGTMAALSVGTLDVSAFGF